MLVGGSTHAFGLAQSNLFDEGENRRPLFTSIEALLLSANFLQLTGIEPDACALRAGVHFHLALRAEKVPQHANASATRAESFWIGLSGGRKAEFGTKQVFVGQFMRFIHLAEFKGIQPKPSAPAITDVDRHSGQMAA